MQNWFSTVAEGFWTVWFEFNSYQLLWKETIWNQTQLSLIRQESVDGIWTLLVFRERNVTQTCKASLVLEFLIQVLVPVVVDRAAFLQPILSKWYGWLLTWKWRHFWYNDGHGNFQTLHHIKYMSAVLGFGIVHTNKPFLFWYLQELVAVRDPPSFYLDKLKAHMTMKGSKVNKSWLKMSKVVVLPWGWGCGMKIWTNVGPYHEYSVALYISYQH